LATLEEGIIDHILTKRAIRFNPDAEPYTKRRLLGELLCSDLGKDARRMRPGPIHIDWAQDCTFSATGIPPARLDKYAQAERRPDEKKLAGVSSSEPINIASISESRFGVSLEPAFHPTTSLFLEKFETTD
jgi:hypothetical protein